MTTPLTSDSTNETPRGAVLPGTTGDNEDLCLHLRAIGMAMCLASFVIISAFFLDSSWLAEQAHSQVEQILDACQRWTPANDGWVEDHAISTFHQRNAKMGVAMVDRNFLLSLPGTSKTVTLSVDVIADPLTAIAPESYPGEYNTPRGSLPRIGVVEQLLLRAPKTVSEFADLWDFIYSQRKVYVGAALLPKAARLSVTRTSVKHSVISYRVVTNVPPAGSMRMRMRALAPAEIQGVSELTGQEDLTHALVGTLPGDISIEEGAVSIQVVIPFSETWSLDLDLQPEFMRRFQTSGWRKGKFEYTFRELNEVTKEYPHVDLTTIERILHSETQRSQEQLEVFGAKIPSRALSTWGIVVLLAAQVYFLFHIAALANRISLPDTAWKVPWVVLYPGRANQLLALASSVLLPTATVVFVGMLAVWRNMHEFSPWAAALPTTLTSVAIAYRTVRHMNTIRGRCGTASLASTGNEGRHPGKFLLNRETAEQAPPADPGGRTDTPSGSAEA